MVFRPELLLPQAAAMPSVTTAIMLLTGSGSHAVQSGAICRCGHVLSASSDLAGQNEVELPLECEGRRRVKCREIRDGPRRPRNPARARHEVRRRHAGGGAPEGARDV